MDIQTDAQTFPAEHRVAILVHSAIAGASIAASLELASREALSPLLLVALGFFAVAIPAAIALVIISQVIYELGRGSKMDDEPERQSWPLLSYVLAVADQITCYLGFLAIFWHFHWIIGFIFLIATLLAYLTTWMAERILRKKRNETLSPSV